MSRNGAGLYTLPAGNPVVTGTVISSTWANNTLSDIATALTQSIANDGQTPITANIPLSGNKITGLAAGTTSGDALSYGQANANLAGLTLTDSLTISGGPLNMVSQPINTAQGADVASASTINLDTATGNLVDVTGTTAITAVTLSQGRSRLVRFTGILTLTNGASLVLPGGANITTAAGDYALFEGYASSVVRVAFYSRASGLPITNVSQTIPRNYIAGLTMSTAGGSGTMTIAAGQAVDSTNTVYMALPSSISKTTSAWAVGSGNGGIDTGSIANTTWYHFYQIRRPDTGVVDIVFSTNASAPTLPTNYTQYRRIGSGLTDGSAHWVAFIQVGGYFRWITPPLDVASVNMTSTYTQVTLTVPPGVVVQAWGNVNPGTSGAIIQVRPVGGLDGTPSFTATPIGNVSSPSSQQGAGRWSQFTNTSRQVEVGGNNTGNTYMTTEGWFDFRGNDQ